MNYCEVKTGLFVLRHCDRPPRAKCSNCAKTVCKRHARQATDQIFCVECFTKLRKDHFKRNYWEDEIWDEEDDDYITWYYFMSDDFHTNIDYEPFQPEDFAGFDREAQLEMHDDMDTGGFFDS